MTLHALTITFAAAAATGCGGFETPPQRVAVSALFASATGPLLTDGSSTLRVTSIVLAPSVGLATSSDDSVGPEAESDGLARVVGAVDPKGALSRLGELDAPRGAHESLEVRLRPLDSEHADDVRAAQERFADLLAMDGAWAVIDGTFDGQPFSLRARSDFTDALPFDGPLTLKLGAPANITVRFDGSQWFRAADGKLLNPAVAQEPELTQSIARSMSALRDADEDGLDDGR